MSTPHAARAILLNWGLLGATLWLAPACKPEPPPKSDEPPAPIAVTATPIAITATEYAFSAPDTIRPGLVTLRLANSGREPHQAGVVRIKGRRTLNQIAAALESNHPPGWMSFVGGPDAVDPGDTTSATQILTPGTYVLVCFLPSPDGTMHLEKGMIRTVVVAGGGDSLPVLPLFGDDTITMSDYTFELAHPLRAGTRRIYVDNKGPQLHELMVIRLAPGKTVDDLLAWTSHYMPGPLPARPLGGIVSLGTGASAVFTVTLRRGKYLLVCFIPDRKDGASHLLHGMVQEIAVE